MAKFATVQRLSIRDEYGLFSSEREPDKAAIINANNSSKDKGSLDENKSSFSNKMESIRAPRTYYPGELIYQDKVFARALHREKKDNQCEFCHKSSDDLIPCNKCNVYAYVKYCGTECQRKDADDHKRECGNLHKLQGDILVSQDNFVRLLARIIFKIKGKSWREISRNILGNCITFEDIDPHYEEMIKNRRLIMLFHELKDGLINFIGEENTPKDEDLLKIIGKVKFSSLDLTTNVYEDFCFGVDQFQHECIPNANIEICDDVVKVWAIKQIVKSEKITISRIPLLNYYLMRSPLTEDNLCECKCTECSLPYSESLLTKVIDKKKAYDAIWISEKAISITGTLSKLQLTDDLRVKHLVNKALEKQEGYLGPTHSLRLKLLTIRGMMLRGEAILMNKDLLELEKNMTMIFGEYYLEMRRVYQSLTYTYIGLQDPLKAAVYSEKKENVKILGPQ